MTVYLLDTNVLSEVVRNPLGPVEQRMLMVEQADLCTSVLVAAELRYGAARKNSARLRAQTDTILARLPVRAWDVPADRAYGELRAHLERAGTPISQNDMLIAAHALALNCILVTDNEAEFRRVPGLAVENWLRDPPVPS
ncbi:type II toxin-antitoxin system VapC family toxin [Brevundimonas sp.]|uniref:type II toxin-antitoxin system VapC family toxin n=1 Tax=Brevundimonas sp. TaxID=1871086 RepID=UPI002E0E7845|nr:type II toxin-antitoxin system VapC family toxin [Brevundimonas sp.]